MKCLLDIKGWLTKSARARQLACSLLLWAMSGLPIEAGMEEPVSVIQFGSGPFHVSESEQYAYLQVVHYSPRSGTPSVHYTTASGTAEAGVDFVPESGIVNFEAVSPFSYGVIRVQVLNNSVTRPT